MEVKFSPEFQRSMDRLFSWRWAPYRWLKAVRRFPREVKWFWQRATRGWADSDTWDFDGYLSKMIGDALEYFAEHTHGAPGDMFDEAAYGPDHRIVDHKLHEQGFENWKATVLKMRDGFRATQEIDELDIDDFGGNWDVFNRKLEELEAKRVEGMTLFVKHFRSLWD